MNVEVKLDSLGNDPTLKNYETPSYEKKNYRNADELSFLQKNKKVKTVEAMLNESPSEAIESDISSFLKQFENSKDKADRIKVVMEGKSRLTKEVKELKEAISNNIAELMESKKAAIRLNNLIHKYEQKVITDQKSVALKLADEITLKELLKDKIHRELQGMRVSSSEYKELDQVNSDDIRRITTEVIKKIGPY